MQILGKRSKVLLVAVAIAMLVAVGVSFAVWDTRAVKATFGNFSSYANAKVGDIVTFGKYYQTGKKASDAEDSEYEKTPIEWLVVDKDERTGELTLMSKFILAAGSYFGNYYYSDSDSWGTHYDSNATVAEIPYNQAYVDSTVRAFLNNLERLDLGGDSFDATNGYLPSVINSTCDKTENGLFTKGTGLLSSVGFSNKKHWTNLYTSSGGNIAALIADQKSGLIKRYEPNNNEIYFQRPITNDEYKNRPATIGFFDEAFDEDEKSMIVAKQIAGYTGHRWPDDERNVATNAYVEGALDKVWLPSVTELNIAQGQDWNEQKDDAWTNSSDEASSTVFEYFKNYTNYTNPVTNTLNTSVAEAVKTTRTTFAKKSFAMNYSIPVYMKGTTIINTDISNLENSSDFYWTRSPSSSVYSHARVVNSSGVFNAWRTHDSSIGVRPCVILKY